LRAARREHDIFRCSRLHRGMARERLARAWATGSAERAACRGPGGVKQMKQAPTTNLKDALAAFGKCVCDGARLMIGVPDYETYAAHMRRMHPEQSVM